VPPAPRGECTLVLGGAPAPEAPRERARAQGGTGAGAWQRPQWQATPPASSDRPPKPASHPPQDLALLHQPPHSSATTVSRWPLGVRLAHSAVQNQQAKLFLFPCLLRLACCSPASGGGLLLLLILCLAPAERSNGRAVLQLGQWWRQPCRCPTRLFWWRRLLVVRADQRSARRTPW